MILIAEKAEKMYNGTKMPVVPIQIGASITAQLFTTDWIHSQNQDNRYGSKAFDGNFATYFHSRGQNQQAMKISFDQLQVDSPPKTPVFELIKATTKRFSDFHEN